MKKETFTVVLTHYNQLNFINEALESIFMQNYSNIELIVIDDCSEKFNVKKVEEYIEQYKSKNIKKYKVIKNKENLGTVKTLNKALSKITGEYFQLFAADDALYDEKVISNFVKAFIKNKNELIITSQALLCGKKLNETEDFFVNTKEALEINQLTAFEQYKKMSFSCFYASGATAYKSEIIKQMGLFDERYKLVEDWSYYLKCTRNNIKIIYEDFITLKHRMGGVSHNAKKTISPTTKKYYMDIINIFETEVLPYLNQFKTKEKYQIINRYINHAKKYKKEIPNLYKTKILVKIKLIFQNFDYCFLFFIRKYKYIYRNYKLNILYRSILWVIISYFLFKIISLNDYLLLTISFVISYVIMLLLKKVKKYVRKCVK